MSKGSPKASVLVTYQSQTGNTKKVAEVIYQTIPEPKKIMPIKDVKSLEGYDLAFLGFPVQGNGPNPKAKAFLEKNTKGKQIALFITHAAPESSPETPTCIQKFKDAASDAEIVDIFDCQGQLSGSLKTMMRLSPVPHLREWARTDNSKGQPDEERLERARIFANRVIANKNGTTKES
jgi:flavodoxin